MEEPQRETAELPFVVEPPRVRTRRSQDLLHLVPLLRDVHERDAYPARWPDDPLAWLCPSDLVTAWVADGARAEHVVGHCALVKVDASRPTAAAWSLASRTPATRLVCVAKLFVASDSRGRGAARVLLDTAVAGAAGIGQRAVLEVSSADQRAVSLYRRAGWIEAGTGSRRDWLPQGAASLLFVAPAESAAPTAGKG